MADFTWRLPLEYENSKLNILEKACDELLRRCIRISCYIEQSYRQKSFWRTNPAAQVFKLFVRFLNLFFYFELKAQMPYNIWKDGVQTRQDKENPPPFSIFPEPISCGAGLPDNRPDALGFSWKNKYVNKSVNQQHCQL